MKVDRLRSYISANKEPNTLTGEKFFAESLILAQDERWRRA